jgi:hypothetical protein
MKSSSENDPKAIRSDIESTRRRLDTTIDAIGNRLHGRHLLDEVVGMVRNTASKSDGDGMGKQILQSASSASRKLVTSVEQNPVPVLLIGAGVAWLAYQGMRDTTQDDADNDSETEFSDSFGAWSPDSTASGSSDSNGGAVKNALTKVGHQITDKARAAGDALSPLTNRAGALGSQISDKARTAYAKTRETVQRTASDKPVELGLGCLAAGVLVGLLIKSPSALNRIAGPKLGNLRRQAQHAAEDMAEDVVEKGKHLAAAGSEAIKNEAKAQGMTLDSQNSNGGGSGSASGGNQSPNSASPSPSSTSTGQQSFS